MRCYYKFANTIEIINSDKLSYNNFKLFITELKLMNGKYNYDIYLAGSYLNYIANNLENYNDINFIITAKKLIELENLETFFKEFHILSNKFYINYDIGYLADATECELNQDIKSFNLLNIINSRIIKLYKEKYYENSLLINRVNNYISIPETELFVGKLITKEMFKKKIQKEQSQKIFKKPIKIL